MTKCHKQGEMYSLEAGRLRLGCQLGQALVRTPSLACRQPPSYHVLTWPFPSACAQRELKLSGVSSYRDTNPIRPGSCPHDQVTPKDPISKNQHIEFEGVEEGHNPACNNFLNFSLLVGKYQFLHLSLVFPSTQSSLLSRATHSGLLLTISSESPDR